LSEVEERERKRKKKERDDLLKDVTNLSSPSHDISHQKKGFRERTERGKRDNERGENSEKREPGSEGGGKGRCDVMR